MTLILIVAIVWALIILAWSTTTDYRSILDIIKDIFKRDKK